MLAIAESDAGPDSFFVVGSGWFGHVQDAAYESLGENLDLGSSRLDWAASSDGTRGMWQSMQFWGSGG